MTSPDPQPSREEADPATALLAAAALGVVAAILLKLSEAGPASGFVAPVFPLVIGGFAVLGIRYARRAWRAVSDSSHSVAPRAMLLAALVIHGILLLVALLMVLAMTVGTGIS